MASGYVLEKGIKGEIIMTPSKDRYKTVDTSINDFIERGINDILPMLSVDEEKKDLFSKVWRLTALREISRLQVEGNYRGRRFYSYDINGSIISDDMRRALLLSGITLDNIIPGNEDTKKSTKLMITRDLQSDAGVLYTFAVEDYGDLLKTLSDSKSTEGNMTGEESLNKDSITLEQPYFPRDERGRHESLESFIKKGIYDVKNIFKPNKDQEEVFIRAWTLNVLDEIMIGVTYTSDYDVKLYAYTSGAGYLTQNMKNALIVSGISKNGKLPENIGICIEAIAMTPELQKQAELLYRQYFCENEKDLDAKVIK